MAAKPKPLVVLGRLGPTLDNGHGPQRWSRWRPTFALCQHPDLLVSRFELLFDISKNLSNNVRRSFMLVLAPNSILITGALLGVFGLGTSLVLNNVFNLVAAVNGLRVQDPLLERRSDTLRS